MNLIFYGLCFILLRVNMNGLDLLPDFVGYFLMYRGLGQLALESRQLSNLRGICLGMLALTLPLWVVTFSVEAALVFGLSFTIARVYILHRLVQVMQELQLRCTDVFFDIETLRVRWALVLTAEAVGYAAVFLGMNNLVTGILGLAGMIISVLFLMAFHRTRQAYRSMTT